MILFERQRVFKILWAHAIWATGKVYLRCGEFVGDNKGRALRKYLANIFSDEPASASAKLQITYPLAGSNYAQHICPFAALTFTQLFVKKKFKERVCLRLLRLYLLAKTNLDL